jgi:hypothetical protein
VLCFLVLLPRLGVPGAERSCWGFRGGGGASAVATCVGLAWVRIATISWVVNHQGVTLTVFVGERRWVPIIERGIQLLGFPHVLHQTKCDILGSSGFHFVSPCTMSFMSTFC